MSNMDLDNFLKQEIPLVDQALIDYLTGKKQQLIKINPSFKKLLEVFIDANREGKRLRALLIKLGYLMAGGKDQKKILDPMLAIEIFHTSILAHDDIIDESPLRRGKPTVYYALGNDHYALSQTICLADYGMFLANKLLVDSNFDEKNKNLALQIFQNIVLDTILGEMIDIEIPSQKILPTQNDANTISLFKTARYTFTGPLQIGAALAGAKTDLFQKLQIYGDNLGIAFQIQDDILGIFGSIEETGKSNSSDMEEGKVTILAAYAFENSDQKPVLQDLYGKKGLNKKEAEQIRHIFKSSGALDFAHQIALKYTQSAISAIDSLDVDQQWKSLLKELADFLMKRKK